MSLRMLLIPAVGAALSIGLLWATEIPLGVPGEWTWGRHSFAETSAREIAWSLGPAVVLLCGYVAFVRWLMPGADGLSAQRMAGLVFTGFAVVWMMQSASPGPYADLQRGWVPYDPAASGYFFEAIRNEKDTREFLADYETLVAGDYVPFGKKEKQRDVYHIGTHPPGLILMHRSLLSVCRDSPRFSGIVLATQPQSSSVAFLELEKSTHLLQDRLTVAERAALWLSVLLTHIAAAAVVIPLYFLVRADNGPRAAWMTAAFWPLVPTVAIFLPKSDALFPLLGLLFLWSWRAALRRRSWWLAAMAGGVMWCGLFLSLALLPAALFAVLLTGWETFGQSASESRGRIWKLPAFLAFIAMAVFVTATAVFFFTTQANLLSIWLENVRNHAGFYEQESHVRTYGTWLLVNPLELAMAVGAPVFLFAVVACFRMLSTGNGWRLRENGPAISGAIVIGLLWLSGKNMGEAGRLWLFLMPWLLWMSAVLWRELPEQLRGQKPVRLAMTESWLGLIILQSVVCLLTVIRVQGFHFGG